MRIRRLAGLQILQTGFTIAGLAALIWLGISQTHHANMTAVRHASVSQPRKHLKETDESGSASNNQGEDISKIVGIATLVVLLGQSWIFARQAGLMRRQADIYDRQAGIMDGQLKATEAAAGGSCRRGYADHFAETLDHC